MIMMAMIVNREDKKERVSVVVDARGIAMRIINYIIIMIFIITILSL